MTPELEKLSDEELVQLRAKAAELLKQRDTERKQKALEQARKIKEKADEEARAVLASVGLGPKAVTPKKKRGAGRRRGKGEAKPAKAKAA